MNIRYQETCDGVSPEQLTGGFFTSWRNPRTPPEHLAILQGSDYVVLALDDDGRVVGFVSVLTDGLQAAFVSFLEVLPDVRGQGVGSALMQRVIERFKHQPALDLTCRADLQPFYARFGMQPSVGAVLRNY